jgi:hypothetical protein
MSVDRSGLCIVRVEAQTSKLLLTVSTESHDGAGTARTRHFTDSEAAISAIREFLDDLIDPPPNTG